MNNKEATIRNREETVKTKEATVNNKQVEAMKIEAKIQNLILDCHELLSQNFTYLTDSRELTEEEANTLNSLEKQSSKYKQMTGLLAIQSYCQEVITLLKKSEPMLEILTILFNSMASIRQNNVFQLEEFAGVQEQVEDMWKNSQILAAIMQDLYPNSQLVTIQKSYLLNQVPEFNLADTIYSRLYQENLELVAKLRQMDEQILDLELKLARILEEHDGCEGDIDSTSKIIELRQQLSLKDAEMDKMNQEFSFEIDKYNTVYDSMKREVERYQGYNGMDLVDLNERLETEIVRFREEAERDQLIIRELKERINFGGGDGYASNNRLYGSQAYQKNSNMAFSRYYY